jgi:hypothetical protein
MKQVSEVWFYATILVSFLLLVETLALTGLFVLGFDAVSKETKCANIICANIICANMDANSFYYDSPSAVCQCYDEKGKVMHMEVV